jgi:cell division protease FtsH
MVMRLPEADKISYLRDKMLADLAVSMGGRVAEELVFGHSKVSSGASSDIQHATKLARAMVTEWGMSDNLGPVLLRDKDEISEATAGAVDAEVQRIVHEAHAMATQILTEYRDELERIAQALILYETLNGEEINQIARGEEISRPDPAAVAPKPVRSSLPSSRKKEEESQ